MPYENYQRIDVIAAPSGWMVQNDGHVAGRFDDQESAYKQALEICASLFEAGVRARVQQVQALAA